MLAQRRRRWAIKPAMLAGSQQEREHSDTVVVRFVAKNSGQ